MVPSLLLVSGPELHRFTEDTWWHWSEVVVLGASTASSLSCNQDFEIIFAEYNVSSVVDNGLRYTLIYIFYIHLSTELFVFHTLLVPVLQCPGLSRRTTVTLVKLEIFLESSFEGGAHTVVDGEVQGGVHHLHTAVG